MNQPKQRTAQPGDIFLLLVPTAQELQRLRAWQVTLQARYGGRIVPNPHITCQRFTPIAGQSNAQCTRKLVTELETIRSFQIYTDSLIQFFAPYWQMQVLRWRVQETDDYTNFRDQLRTALHMIRCPSHFDRQRYASCTSIDLDQASGLEIDQTEFNFPAPLFIARELWISELNENWDFTIRETLIFQEP